MAGEKVRLPNERATSLPTLYGKALESRAAHCLRLVTAVACLTMPELVTRLVHARPQAMRYRVLARFAWYRRSMQHVRYAF